MTGSRDDYFSSALEPIVNKSNLQETYPAGTAALSRASDGPPAALARRASSHRLGTLTIRTGLDPAIVRTAAPRPDDCERTSVVQRFGAGKATCCCGHPK